MWVTRYDGDQVVILRCLGLKVIKSCGFLRVSRYCGVWVEVLWCSSLKVRVPSAECNVS